MAKQPMVFVKVPFQLSVGHSCEVVIWLVWLLNKRVMLSFQPAVHLKQVLLSFCPSKLPDTTKIIVFVCFVCVLTIYV